MKKVFKTPLDQACGKNKIVDQFHYIYFKNGFIYVSNGVVHLKQLMQLHGMTKPTIMDLDGCCISKDVFKLLNRQKDVYFRRLIEDIGGGVSAHFSLAESIVFCSIQKSRNVPGQGLIVDQIDNMTKDFQMEAKREIAIDPATIETLRKVFVTQSSGFTLRFNKGKTGVLITPNQSDYKEHAIVKTLKLTGEINK